MNKLMSAIVKENSLPIYVIYYGNFPSQTLAGVEFLFISHMYFRVIHGKYII